MKTHIHLPAVFILLFLLAPAVWAQPAITQLPTNQTVTVGGTLSLSVTVSGSSPVYQWFKDNRFLAGATNSALNITNAGVTNTGIYYVAVTNSGGIVISLPVSVMVGNPILAAWGTNDIGQLGNGTTNNANLPIIVATNVVTGGAGYGHSLFITSDGVLWGMGANGYGALGNGTTSNTNRPISVASNVVAVAAGEYHSLFIKTNGTLWAMGYNYYGQLGNGTSDINSHPLPVSVASNVVAVAAGYNFSLFVKNDGTLWMMGENEYGQFGNGTSGNQYNTPISVASNVVVVAAGYAHSMFVKMNGTLWAMGFDGSGQLGNGITDNYPWPPHPTPIIVASNVIAVAGGAGHTLFVKTNGTLWVTGGNNYGQLGNGGPANTNVFTPTSVASNVVAVAAGWNHSVFTKTDGTIWAMGRNISGELGNGTTNNTNLPINVFCVKSAANIFPAVSAHHTLAIGVMQSPIIASFTNSRTNRQQMTLQLSGTPNYPYILQTATNLTPPVNWQPIWTNPADVNGNWSFSISNLSGAKSFFRATSQ